MLKRTIIIFSLILQVLIIPGFFNETRGANTAKTCIEICYTETVISNGRTYLYEYACDGTLINIVELED